MLKPQVPMTLFYEHVRFKVLPRLPNGWAEASGSNNYLCSENCAMQRAGCSLVEEIKLQRPQGGCGEVE